jgi:hypothetical protein
VQTGSYSDLTYYTDGQYLMFDQRMYTTPDEADRANLSLDGWLWIPNRCADGSNTQCHLSVATGGCGNKWDHWWNIATDLPKMNTYIG